MRRIDWKRGGSTVLVYFYTSWLIVLVGILFVRYADTFVKIEKTQLFADIFADGCAYAGDTGWGIDAEEVEKTKSRLIEYNKADYPDTFMEIKIGKSSARVQEKDMVTAKASYSGSAYGSNDSISIDKTAKTRITYSGGMAIVREAYRHSYQYNPTTQTRYIYGAGHGISNDSMEWMLYADCSGFVSGVFRKCGYFVSSDSYTGSLERTGKLVGEGYTALEKARPGDIILYWRNGDTADGNSKHVAIYAGKHDNTYYQIHSSGSQSCNSVITAGRGPDRGVKLSGIEYGASRIMIRRMVQENGKAYEMPEELQYLTSNIVRIPLGLGRFFSYMSWQQVTNQFTSAYQFRVQTGMSFDEEGFGRVNGRYVIACTSTFGTTGDYVDFYQSNGNVLHCVIGDEKSQEYTWYDHNPANVWGHDGGQCIVEFVVDKNIWYTNGHDNPGTISCHPEWGGQTLTKAVKRGNYFTNPNFKVE